MYIHTTVGVVPWDDDDDGGADKKKARFAVLREPAAGGDVDAPWLHAFLNSPRSPPIKIRAHSAPLFRHSTGET